MHEQSLIRSLIEQADAIRRQHGRQRIVEIQLELGPLSGAEPLLLQSAFQLLAPGTPAAEAGLVIESAPLLARCELCGWTGELAELDFRCVACGAGLRVLSGDQVILVSVSLDDEQLDDELAYDASASGHSLTQSDPGR